jgi:DNA-binding transcriptional regulator LsrR (DeoR family)
MNNETSGSETPHVKVRMLLRQVGLDQVELAKKLNLSEPVISSALNGKNEKSFQRIVVLLMREYNFTHEDIYQQSITLTQSVVALYQNRVRQSIARFGKPQRNKPQKKC